MKKRLQIFISSTYLDLKDERQAAVEAILKSGHIPAGMELFTAGDEEQLKTIYRWIESSDIFLLILGGRYGSIHPKTSLSYTELEYDYAKSKGIKFFAVVMEKEELQNRKKDGEVAFVEKDNVEKYDKFRKKVLSYTSTFFKDAKDIKSEVQATTTDFIERYTFKGWVRGQNNLEKPNQKIILGNLSLDDDKIDLSFRRIREILEKKIIKTAIYDSFLKDYTLYAILLNHRDQIIGGVNTIQAGSPEKLFQFLYSQVMPKLMVYGLVKRERYTVIKDLETERYILSQRGLDFLAFIDTNPKPDLSLLGKLKLKKSDDLSIKNETLQNQLSEWANNDLPDVEGIADLDDKFTIRGRYDSGHYSVGWQASLTWREIFKTVAPYALKFSAENWLQSVLGRELSQKYNRTGGSIDSDNFQTVKIQLLALKLIKIEHRETVKGHSDWFWELTKKGKNLMMQVRTVLKNRNPLRD